MGLKARMIQSMLEKHSVGLVAALNQKLGTQFEYVFDWACIPADVDGWNWSDADLQTCLHTSYFKPVEDTFAQLFANAAMYREAITGQIKRIKVVPGRSTMADFDIEGDALLVKNTLCANQLNGPGMYLDAARSSIENVINRKLA